MNKNRYVISSLPLIADILGRKYGVKVSIGGKSACTDGKTIYLPSLPLNSDEITLNLARAYADHESAHLRETDFAILREAKLSSLEKFVWNILEDHTVEQKLSAIFPGCKHNLVWLIRHIFLAQNVAELLREDPVAQVLNWLLISVRSWVAAELESQKEALARSFGNFFPGLKEPLENLLKTVPTRCKDTASCIEIARELVNVLKKYAHTNPNQASDSTDNPAEQNSSLPKEPGLRQLQDFLDNPKPELPQELGEILSKSLQDLHNLEEEQLSVARVNQKVARPLNQESLKKALQATTALRTRLRALLQSTILSRNHGGHRGKIDSRHLYRLETANPRIFLRQNKKQSLNTAIHILLDASGSMRGRNMELASKACFAIASAIYSIPKVSVAVTAFPGEPYSERETSQLNWQTVSPILKHGEKIHNRFQISPAGGTPMAPAIWWVFQQMVHLKEERKIILLISDGEANSPRAVAEAIKVIQASGFETYGIGVETSSINKLLSARNSQTINNIQELAPAMFKILQSVLTKIKLQH